MASLETQIHKIKQIDDLYKKELGEIEYLTYASQLADYDNALDIVITYNYPEIEPTTLYYRMSDAQVRAFEFDKIKEQVEGFKDAIRKHLLTKGIIVEF